MKGALLVVDSNVVIKVEIELIVMVLLTVTGICPEVSPGEESIVIVTGPLREWLFKSRNNRIYLRMLRTTYSSIGVELGGVHKKAK